MHYIHGSLYKDSDETRVTLYIKQKEKNEKEQETTKKDKRKEITLSTRACTK